MPAAVWKQESPLQLRLENVSAVSADSSPPSRKRLQAVCVGVVALTIAGATVWASLSLTRSELTKPSPPARAKSDVFYPTDAQQKTFTTEAVRQTVFRPIYVTEGKIAVNEDRATPVFSPYSGRV